MRELGEFLRQPVSLGTLDVQAHTFPPFLPPL
jgi:hypothetical protein